jgi:hypothetical protein
VDQKSQQIVKNINNLPTQGQGQENPIKKLF